MGAVDSVGVFPFSISALKNTSPTAAVKRGVANYRV